MTSNEQPSGLPGRRGETVPPRGDNIINNTQNSNENNTASWPMQQQVPIGIPAGIPLVQQGPIINPADPNALLAATSALGVLVSCLPGGAALSASALAQVLQAAARQQHQHPIAVAPQQGHVPAFPGAATFVQGGAFPTMNTLRAAPNPDSMANSSLPAAANMATLANLQLQLDSTTSSQATTNAQLFPPLPAAGLQEVTESLSTVPTFTGRCIYLDQDELELSPYQCLVRQQIEIFEIPPNPNSVHNEDGQTCQGRNRPVVPGQVGIRCRHCGTRGDPDLRARGAILFPSTLLGVYQTAQNMANTHLVRTCKLIPDATRRELLRVRNREEGKQTRKSAYGGGRKYWSTALSVMGVVDTPERRLRFASSIQKNTEASRESQEEFGSNTTTNSSKYKTGGDNKSDDSDDPAAL